MDSVEWRRISGTWRQGKDRTDAVRHDSPTEKLTQETNDAYIVSSPDDTVCLHHIMLETLTARNPVCVRLMLIDAKDKVKVYLGHKCHTPFLIPNVVDTFMDIWIDPFEFAADKYNLDNLPSHLSVHIEWEARHPEASAFVLVDPSSCWNVSLVEYGILVDE